MYRPHARPLARRVGENLGGGSGNRGACPPRGVRGLPGMVGARTDLAAGVGKRPSAASATIGVAWRDGGDRFAPDAVHLTELGVGGSEPISRARSDHAGVGLGRRRAVGTGDHEPCRPSTR